MSKNPTVLALSPHPDDIELACGGTIVKFVEMGYDIHYIVFSPCNKSLPEGYKKNELYEEMKVATQRLGLDPNKVYQEFFPVREFPKNRQEILERLVKANREINPDIVLLPNSNDLHQDHKTIYEEGMRAFKKKKILGYELLWNNDNFKSNFFVKLERRQIDAKKHALLAYNSQTFRGYFNDEFLYGLAKVRGVQAGGEYAEAFELIRWDI